MAADVSRRIYTEARRGWQRAQVKVVVGDGAEWIRNICEEQFWGATQIVDLYQVLLWFRRERIELPMRIFDQPHGRTVWSLPEPRQSNKGHLSLATSTLGCSTARPAPGQRLAG